ncbi:TPA: hypothetical protein ACK4XB_002034, partial [Neisseria gonorrhoeae]
REEKRREEKRREEKRREEKRREEKRREEKVFCGLDSFSAPYIGLTGCRALKRNRYIISTGTDDPARLANP